MLPKRKAARRAARALAVIALAAGMIAPVLVAPAVTAQERLPATAAAAPEDTVIYAVMDLDLEGSQWQLTEELLARVGVPDALDLWRGEILSEGQASGEFSQADLDALLGGEVALVVTPTAVQKMLEMQAKMEKNGHGHAVEEAAPGATPSAPGEAEPLGMAAVLQPGDPEAAWDYVVRQTNALAEKTGIELMVASGPGEDMIWADGLPADQESEWSDDPFEAMFGHGGEGAFAVGHSGGFIVAAQNPADVTSIMDVIDGAAPSLAASEDALDVASRLPEESLSFAYVNASGVIDALDPEMLEMLQSFVPANMPPEALGGHGAMAISADENGFRFDSLSIPVEGVDVSAFTVQNDPGVAIAAQQAPAGTFIFSAGKLPPNAFAGAAFGLAQAVNDASAGGSHEENAMTAIPTAEEIDEQIAQAAQTLGFNPQTELFDLLGSEFILFSTFPSFSFEGFGMDAVFSIATTDPVVLGQTMEKIAALGESAGEMDVSIRQVGSDTVYIASDPSTTEVPAIEFGVLGDRAVFSIGQGIEQLTSEQAASLADDEQYQAVMSLLPTEFYQVSYLDFSLAMAPIMMLTGEFGSAAVVDADLACGSYETQELAQAAYDADTVTNMALDQDFDGTACEDAFAAASGTPGAPAGSLTNIRAFGMVTFQDESTTGASGILYIAQPGA